MKRIKAETFEVGLSFNGAPVTLYVRLFIDEGKVLAVRRLKLRGPRGELPSLTSGWWDFNDDGAPAAEETAPGSACAPSPESPQATDGESEPAAAVASPSEPPRE